MDMERLEKIAESAWQLPQTPKMRVPAIIYATEALIRDMDDKVAEQLTNVATLPGIVSGAYAMPDAHWGYGFPIGGVAAFSAEEGGVVSAGGVGFDISCGVRALHTGLHLHDIREHQKRLADELFRVIPAGLGSRGHIRMTMPAMDTMLKGGAQWAVKQGWGEEADLTFIEEHGCMAGARPECVSEHAKQRQLQEMGTLGSGNHYLEVQHVTEIYDEQTAAVFNIHQGDIKVSIHCGSRGLGHQIGSEFLRRMVVQAHSHGLELPDRELACAPLTSELGREYLGAMRAGINCALANRQILTDLTRKAFKVFYPDIAMPLLFDVSHNTCKEEEHVVDGQSRRLFVHRKGATRAFGPGDPDLPSVYRDAGQPVLIGGTMGTASYILAGNRQSREISFHSACHGAGRAMSRNQAKRQWRGEQVINELARHEIIIRSPSLRGVAEEAPGAYKDVSAVVDAAEMAGLARKVAKLEPLICIKG